jgi:4'-phosphopantetheinyl transferase
MDEGDAWLTPAEAAILGRFRVSKRAADWRLGRWVAKEAVARALEGSARKPGTSGPPDRAHIEILSGPGGSPRARVLAPGHWPAVVVSLSHSAGAGFAAATVDDDGVMRLGCDVEEIAPRSEGFVSDYFTAEEAAWILGDDRHLRANLLWSAKESALKALGEGLRRDTRSVVVEVSGLPGPAAVGVAAPGGPVASGWHPLTASTARRPEITGRWKSADGRVWTVVGWKDPGGT